MTSPVVVQPDLDAHVWSQLKDIPGVTAFTYAATQQDRAGWIMAHFVQVDARLKRRGPARAAAERVRQVMTALGDVPWADGVVCYVQPVEGPFWLPDPDGFPRYVARYEVRVHPTRPGAIPPATPAASTEGA